MSAGYYLLFRRDGAVQVADATELIGNCFPSALIIYHHKYQIVRNEDTFFFWDEFIDGDDRTVGFTFVLPANLTLRSSRLLSDSSNTSIDGVEVHIDLCPGVRHEVEGTQGFYSEVYQSDDDPADCAILMFNWSGREAGFEMVENAIG